MSYIKNVCKAIVVAIVSIILMLPSSNAYASYDATDQGFLGFINKYRTEKGLSALTVDSKIQDAASWMSADMLSHCVVKGYPCNHTDSTGRDFARRLRDFGYPAGVTLAAAENIIWGSGRDITAEQAFNIWKASSGHNSNMLNGTYAAIGISHSCNAGGCAWVTDFGSKVIQPYSSTITATPAPVKTLTPAPTIAPISTSVPTLTRTPSPAPIPILNFSPSITKTPVPTIYPTPVLKLTSTPIPVKPTLAPTKPIVTLTPVLTPTPIVSPSTVLPDGSLVRGKGEIDVYIIKYAGPKKIKRLILSPSVFRNYSHLKWENVITIEKSVLDSFTTSNLVRATGDDKIYSLYPSGDTGEKKWIKTSDAFARLGYDWDAVYEINQFDRDSYLSVSAVE